MNINVAILSIATSIVSLALISCGGSGGNNSNTAESPPSILDHPKDQTVLSPTQGTFTVLTGGNPAPEYQWQRNDGTGWQNVSTGTGASGPTYTTASTARADNGVQYRVIVRNILGTATSIQAKLTVFPNPREAISSAYQAIFGLNIPIPVVASGTQVVNGIFATRYVSTAYLGDSMYRIYLDTDWSVNSLRLSVKRPVGVFRVAVVAIDYGHFNIAQVLDNEWRNSQDEINALHAAFAAKIGLSAPIVKFSNTNYLALPQQISMPRGRTEVMAYLASVGLLPLRDFDIAVLLDLNADVLAGGYAGSGSDFVYMGCYFCTSGARFRLDASTLSNLARAVYNHEVGHIWGWEHEWANGSCSGGGNPCDGFITVPGLFGWTDVDGDGIPEILDPNPYGMR